MSSGGGDFAHNPKFHPWTSEGLTPEKIKLDRFNQWTFKGLTPEQKILLWRSVDENPDLEYMITPYPIAMDLASYVEKDELVRNLIIFNGRIVITDAMVGSGMDTMALKNKFLGRVIIDVYDIDQLQLKSILGFLKHSDQCRDYSSVFRNAAARDVLSLVKTSVPDSIDLLFLDPPWPGAENFEEEDYKHATYMLNGADGSQKPLLVFIDEAFKKIPTLEMVVCKVAKFFFEVAGIANNFTSKNVGVSYHDNKNLEFLQYTPGQLTDSQISVCDYNPGGKPVNCKKLNYASGKGKIRYLIVTRKIKQGEDALKNRRGRLEMAEKQ